MPSSSQAADNPVPVPSSRKLPDGFAAASVLRSEPVIRSEPMVKPIFFVASSISLSTAGGLRLTVSSIVSLPCKLKSFKAFQADRHDSRQRRTSGWSLHWNSSPINQRFEVIQCRRVAICRPAVGMNQDMPVQIEQGDEPFAFACPPRAAYQLILSLFQQQGENR